MSGSGLGAKAAAVRETIAELCEQPPAAPELVEEVAERVRRIVPHDSGAWMTTDPQSLLPTSVHKLPGSAELSDAFARAELMDDRPDVNSFPELLRTGRTAAALSLSTAGDLESSWRHREVHIPFGLKDELRLVARSANETWALGCISRADDLPDFTAEEVRWTASIAEHLGAGVRTALSRHASPPATVRGPGMLVLDAEGGVEASTGEADRWLEGLPSFNGGLPAPIVSVALQAQANAMGSTAGRAARLRLNLPTGGWLLVHADVLRAAGEAAGRVAVMLEPADRAELVPLLLALHGLTGREREVAELLVSGRSTEEIAARLHISRHTLRDHVKSIFAKVGVSSRPELTAALGQEPIAA